MSRGNKEISAALNVLFKSFYDFGSHSIPAAEDNPLVVLHNLKRCGCGNYVVLTVCGRAAIVEVTEVSALVPSARGVNVITRIWNQIKRPVRKYTKVFSDNL